MDQEDLDFKDQDRQEMNKFYQTSINRYKQQLKLLKSEEEVKTIENIINMLKRNQKKLLESENFV